MTIKNRTTGKEEQVTAEQWEAIESHPQLRGKYLVIKPDKPAPPTPPEAKEQTEQPKERKKQS